MSMNYWGITYPHVFRFRLIRWVWKKINCKRGMHLFDEVQNTSVYISQEDEHYLTCDACNLIINVTTIDRSYI